ncbi:MAG: nuclear transport factor 2 family protein [Pseudomonadota bacterium]
MMKFDPHNSWLALRDKASNTNNTDHKALLNEVANHMEAEITGQLEPLMATLDPDPIYHFWRVGGQNMILQGYEAVAGFYSNMFTTGGQQFQVVCDRIFVDSTGVITEGQVRQVYKADALAALGLTHAQDKLLSCSELWVSRAQLITVWPRAAGNKLVGEDIYFGEDPMQTLEPIQATELPDYYQLA